MHNYPFPDDPTPVVEAAKRLGIHRVTIGRWIRDGKLPAWRIGPTSWGMKRRLVVSMRLTMQLCTERVVSRPQAAAARAEEKAERDAGINRLVESWRTERRAKAAAKKAAKNGTPPA
jgi:excisionase family DNA binding protein